MVGDAAGGREDERGHQGGTAAHRRHQLPGDERGGDLDDGHQDEVEVTVPRQRHRVYAEAVVHKHRGNPVGPSSRYVNGGNACAL